MSIKFNSFRCLRRITALAIMCAAFTPHAHAQQGVNSVPGQNLPVGAGGSIYMMIDTNGVMAIGAAPNNTGQSFGGLLNINPAINTLTATGNLIDNGILSVNASSPTTAIANFINTGGPYTVWAQSSTNWTVLNSNTWGLNTNGNIGGVNGTFLGAVTAATSVSAPTINGTNVNIANQVCLNGSCISAWPSSSSGSVQQGGNASLNTVSANTICLSGVCRSSWPPFGTHAAMATGLYMWGQTFCPGGYGMYGFYATPGCNPYNSEVICVEAWCE